MSALKDLTGRKFGMLTVIKRGDNDKFNKPQYWCKCDCGSPELILKRGNDLSQGKIKSCGCLKHNKPKKEKPKNKSKSDLLKEERTGEERYNNAGDLMKIILYENTTHVLIEFQDEYKYQVMVGYGNFTKGTIKNPYHKMLYGKGYIGVGDYRPTQNRKATAVYDAWRKMFDRCYSKNQEPTYADCTVCEEWYNFQNFAKWYEENYWEEEQYSLQVDKDWLVFHNTVYSPKTCSLVPSIINLCLMRPNKNNQGLPRNIQLTASGKYKPQLSKYGKQVELGTYENLIDAMKVYKNAKIEYVKELALKYRQYITPQLYEAMMNFENRLIKELPEYGKI